MYEKQIAKVLPVKMPDNLIGGVYANNVLISHTKEEFIMTFMLIAEPVGAVTSRVIMSPGHMKRFISALQENENKYEEKIGTITEAPEPPKAEIGFAKP